VLRSNAEPDVWLLIREGERRGTVGRAVTAALIVAGCGRSPNPKHEAEFDRYQGQISACADEWAGNRLAVKTCQKQVKAEWEARWSQTEHAPPMHENGDAGPAPKWSPAQPQDFSLCLRDYEHIDQLAEWWAARNPNATPLCDSRT
jgi:hypothetical protein